MASRSLRLPVLVLATMAALVIVAKVFFPGRLVLNRTPSVPRGVYWLSQAESLARGDLVAFPIPEEVRGLLHARGVVPEGGFFDLLAKPIAALGGDRVCIRDRELWINERTTSSVPLTDSLARPLPEQSFCRTLSEDEVFVATTRPSFDSRYFGPVRRSELRGTLRPLLTFARDAAPARDATSPHEDQRSISR